MGKQQLERMGQLIRIARIQAGNMTQGDLGAELGLSVATVSDYERGQRRRVSRAEVLALEEALQIEDRRLMRAAGYDPPADPGSNILHYSGDQLTAKQEEAIRWFIDCVRSPNDEDAP